MQNTFSCNMAGTVDDAVKEIAAREAAAAAKEAANAAKETAKAAAKAEAVARRTRLQQAREQGASNPKSPS